jgi:hypothetical protein
VWVHGSFLRANAYEFLDFGGFFLNVEIVDSGGAACWFNEPAQNVYGCGFAGSVGSQQPEEFSFCDAQAYAIYGSDIFKFLDKVVQLNG